jgi:hypothetical protein
LSPTGWLTLQAGRYATFHRWRTIPADNCGRSAIRLSLQMHVACQIASPVAGRV